MNDSSPANEEDTRAFTLFGNGDFRRYISTRFLIILGTQMTITALDWEIYQRTHSGLALGFVGLALMIPMFLCTLPAGHTADSFNRKKITEISTGVLSIAALLLALASAFISHGGWVFPACAYSLMVLCGVARTFLAPANAALVTSLVSRQELPKAITFNSGAFQLACVIGPAAAGLAIWLTKCAWPVYAFNAVTGLICVMLLSGIHHEHTLPPREPISLRSLITGFQFVYQNKIILGTLTLDMFAVLLGGAVTLLPIFASDIIQLPGDPRGELGLGILRTAIPIGAILCVFYLAHRPAIQRAGSTMLRCVAIFGMASAIFGLTNASMFGKFLTLSNSEWFWISFSLMALCGAVDNVSVVIRQTLVQILTPDEKRGRVSAVNSLFIGTSNELGGFESGLTAQMFGPWMHQSIAMGAIYSVAFGGVGTIVVVLLIGWIWPEMRRYGKLE